MNSSHTNKFIYDYNEVVGLYLEQLKYNNYHENLNNKTHTHNQYLRIEIVDNLPRVFCGDYYAFLISCDSHFPIEIRKKYITYNQSSMNKLFYANEKKIRTNPQLVYTIFDEQIINECRDPQTCDNLEQQKNTYINKLNDQINLLIDPVFENKNTYWFTNLDKLQIVWIKANTKFRIDGTNNSEVIVNLEDDRLFY